MNQRTIVNLASVARPTKKLIHHILKPKKANCAHTHSSVSIVEANIRWTLQHVHSGRTISIESSTRRSTLRSVKTGSNQFIWLEIVIATTRWNDTYSLFTSAKLLVGYLVVGITRELDKKPLLHCSSIYINYMWSMLQQYLLVLMSMPLPHVLLLIYHASFSRLPCHVHVPWCHTL